MRKKEFCAPPLLHPWPWVHFKQIYLLPFRVPLSGSQPPGEVCVTSPPRHKWDLPETTSSRRNMFLPLLKEKTKTKNKKTKKTKRQKDKLKLFLPLLEGGAPSKIMGCRYQLPLIKSTPT